jgi:hypothetical protein
MASQAVPASASSASATAVSTSAASSSIRSSKLWLRGAFLLAGAAQLITISALLSADPLAAGWSALLLAIAPAPLAALAAFTPRAVARLAAIAAAVAVIIGIAGGIGRTGSLFIPALIALVVGGALLWLSEPRRA